MRGCLEFLFKFCITIFIIVFVIYHISVYAKDRDDRYRIQKELNNKVKVMKWRSLLILLLNRLEFHFALERLSSAYGLIIKIEVIGVKNGMNPTLLQMN